MTAQATLQKVNGLSDYAIKLERYAKHHLEKFPDAMAEACMNHAVCQLVDEYGGKNHLAELALTELAACYIFRSKD
jgi:hypothetical protein